MLEACATIFILFACVIGIILVVKWCYSLHDNHGIDRKASTELEHYMKYNEVASVRALLEVRGHLLKKEVVNNAKVWLAEK
jgi:hypothetical protein